MSKHRATRTHTKTATRRYVPAHDARRTPAPRVEPVTYFPSPRAARPVDTGIGAWMTGLTPEDAKYWRTR